MSLSGEYSEWGRRGGGDKSGVKNNVPSLKAEKQRWKDRSQDLYLPNAGSLQENTTTILEHCQLLRIGTNL